MHLQLACMPRIEDSSRFDRGPLVRLFRIAAYLVGALLVLATLILVGLHTPPARRAVLSYVQRVLAETDVDFAADQLRYNLMSLSLSARDVSVGSRRDGRPPLARIASAEVDLSLWSLVRGRYVVQRATVTGLDVSYVVDEAGEDNIPRLSKASDTKEGSTDYLLRQLAVTDARVRYENHATRVVADVPVRSIRVSGSTVNRHTIQIASEGGSVHVQDRGLPLGQLSGQLVLGSDDVAISELRVEAAGSQMRLAGTVVGFAQPTMDLRLESAVDLAPLAQFGGMAQRIAGVIRVDAHATGPVERAIVEGRVQGRDLAIEGFDHLAIDLSAVYDMGARVARLDTLRLQAPWALLTAGGVIGLDEDGQSRMDVAVRGLDAAAVSAAAALPYAAATRLDVRMNATWRGTDVRRASGDLTAFLTAQRPVQAGAVPLSGQIAIDAREGAVRARIDGLRTTGLESSGRLSLSPTDSLEGVLQIRSNDVGAAISTAEATLRRRRGSLVPVPLSGAATVDARVAGTVGAPSASVTILAPQLTIDTVTGVGVSARAAYTPDAIEIQTADVAWQEATAHVDGRVGLTGARPIALSMSADALQIPMVVELVKGSPLPVTGVAALRADVRGTMTRPAAAVEARASELVAYGEPIGTLTASARLDDRSVSVSQLLLEKPQAGGAGRLEASGRYHLDRGTYQLDVRSDVLQVTDLVLSDSQRVSAAVALNGRGEGTVRNPAGTLALDVSDVRVGDEAYGNLDVDVVLADRRATITAAADRFNAHVSALVGTSQPYPSTITARVDRLDLQNLPVHPETPLTGHLSASVQSTADLARPAGGRADLSIEAFAGEWNGRPFHIDGPALLHYAEERLTIDALKLAAQDSTLSVTGTLPLTAAAGEGAVQLESLLNLGTLAEYAPSGISVSGEGTIAIAGSIRGSLEAVDPQITIAIEDGLLLSPTFEPGIADLTARATVGGGEAVLEKLSATWGSAAIAASARLPFAMLPELPVAIPRQAGPAAFHAAVTGLDPAAVPGAPAGLTGRISIDAEATGTSVSDLGALSGRITFPELSLGFRELSVAQEQPVTVSIEQSTATLEEFSLTGSVGSLSASGRMELQGERRIDARAGGNINLATVSLFTDALRAEGATRLSLSAQGTVDHPDLNGTVELANATLAIDEPRVAAEDLSAQMTLAGSRVTLQSLTAQVNGGALNGSGVVGFGSGGIEELDLQIATKDFAFDAPLELRSLSDSTIRVNKRGDEFVVDGTVSIKDAGLTGDINFDTGLLAAVTARRQLDLTAKRNPLLERTRFNFRVDTASPVLVDNNLARAEVTTDLRVLGTPYETGLSGQLTLLEGGELTLNERRYEIERGVVTFLDERRILPSFDLSLETRASRYDVSIVVTGTPGETETTLTSTPTLPEPDIMALLVTGRTLDEMRGEEYDVAREQVLSYLTGRIGSQLGRGIERATGLSEVRIEPNLIANETDPSARLTVGQDITDDLGLVYSTNLTDSNDQIWVGQYDLTRRFQTRAVRQSDNSYRLDFRHDVRFGGEPEPRRQAPLRLRIGTVRVPGDVEPGEHELRRMLRAEEGESYDYFAIRRGVERIERGYRERGYLQSRVRLDRKQNEKTVDLELRVSLGPRVDLTFVGAQPPAGVREQVEEQWRRGVFDAQRIDDVREVVRAWLMAEHYLQPTVEVAVQGDGARREVTVTVTPGARSDKILLAFEGASGVRPDVLDEIIEQQDLEAKLFTDPLVVTELLQRYYHEQAYLSAQIAEPRFEFVGPVARVVLDVDEGPQFTTSRIAVTGNRVFDTDSLLREFPLVVGDAFLPAVAERSLERIRDLYWRRGYNDVRSDYNVVVDRDRGQVQVTFEITEGRQAIVADVAIEGTVETSEQLVRQEVQLTPSEPLDLAALGRSRKNLYNTGAFSMVDLTREEVAPADSDGAAASTDAAADASKPVRVRVAVREVQPFQIGYGASYDTERGLGGIFDIANYNSLGQARVVGARTRYDAQLREVRGYLSQPSLRRWPVKTTAAIYYREERNPQTNLADAFNFDRRGVSIQQEKELRNSYVWSYGYRYERVRTFDPMAGGRDETLSVSPLTSTFTREARDEALDASRGSFTSHALSFAPSWLGGDAAYLKYFGQYFHYFPLQPVRRKPLTNELLRPRLVYAAGVRLGLARGLGGAVPAGERFFAGGSTTLRGFEQNAVGPIGEDRIPAGGEALFVINNELRVPLVSIVDGVVFADIGNVFDGVRDFSFAELRESAGLGVRLRTPWFLIRGDWGVVLDHRAGERRSRFYFSIGQAF